MLKYQFILTGVLLLIGAPVIFAQQKIEVGISTGYTRNSLTTENGYRSFTRHYPLNGFQIAIPARYNFSDWFSLQLDVAYIQKNYAVRRTNFFKGVESEIKNSSIHLPLMAHFSFGSAKSRGFLNLGAYSEYWINSHIRGANGSGFSNPNYVESDKVLFSDLFKLEHFDEKIAFDSRRDRRFQLGMIAGVGFEQRLNSKFKAFVEARYQHSVTDLQKNYMINQIPRYNNTFGVQLGAFYSIAR